MGSIVEVTYNFPCEVFIHRHVEALIRHEFPVQLIARHTEKRYEAASTQNEVGGNPAILIAPQFDHLTNLQKILSLRYLLLSRSRRNNTLPIRDQVMIGYFRGLRPDLIHFHFASLAQLMRWVPQELGIPYTVSLRGSDVQVSPLLSADFGEKMAVTLKKASGIHSVSDALWHTAKSNLKLGTDSVFHQTIYTTVPISMNPIDLRKQTPGGMCKFISIGRLHWTKGYVNFLLAFRTLLDHNLKAELTIVGDGPARDELVYWIHTLRLVDSVKLPGILPYKEFSRLMEDSSAFVQSSVAEGFSNATAEAMALGLPVFATDVGGTSEIIKDGVNGFLLDPFRPEAWWKKLVLVKDPRLMESIGWAAWKTAGETFAAERHAREFADFYDKALHG